MGMDSDKIKAIVAKVNALRRGEGQPDDVMDSMCKDMGKSPTLAVAIIAHLRDEGHDLFTLSGDKAEAFREKFKAKVEKLGERELSQLKTISKRLLT